MGVVAEPLAVGLPSAPSRGLAQGPRDGRADGPSVVRLGLAQPARRDQEIQNRKCSDLSEQFWFTSESRNADAHN